MGNRHPSSRSSGRPAAGTTSARNSLLRAAATHFSRYGFAGANIRAILADADATAPALYHHFGSKTGLYIATAVEAQEHVLGAFRAATADRTSLADRISALLAAAVALRQQHPNVARYLSIVQQDQTRHPELRELAAYEAQFKEFWQSMTDAPRDRGTAIGLRAVIEGILAVGGADVPLKDVAAGADALERIIRRGLRPLSAGTKRHLSPT